MLATIGYPASDVQVSTESVARCAVIPFIFPAENKMTTVETLRMSLLSVEANEDFTEAVMSFNDGSRLCFCHRVGERWAKSVGTDQREEEGGLAGEMLAAIRMFRLNAKHLDVEFDDGSRWDELVGGSENKSE